MRDKLAIVTGANSGMGLATTIELAKRGAKVVMVCRSESRGREALAEAARQSGSAELELMICDLGSLASIRSFASELLGKHPVIDVLVNNAGVVTIKRESTQDGFESMIGINHLGHFLLTLLLLNGLRRSKQGRIVVVSSGAHKIGRIHFPDPHLRKGFNVARGYAQSKLANILFANELAERLRGTPVTVNSLHPGAVATSIGVDRRTGFGQSVHAMLRPFFLTPTEGSATAVYLAMSPEVAGVTGSYFYRCKKAPVSARAFDRELSKRLWEWSERETGMSIQPTSIH